MKKVCYVYPPAYHYRSAFNERLRSILRDHDVDYTVIYSDLGGRERFKNDTVDIEWGVKVPMLRLPFGLEYQKALKSALGNDLVIIQQENKLLVNYIFNILALIGARRVAFFGHGRNFQSRRPDGIGERVKRFWATKVSWWFGYTEETRRHIESLGFPPGKITVFNNAVDTSEVRAQIADAEPQRLAELRAELGIEEQPVGIFVGSLYPDRRLAFLVDAADRIRAHIPNFVLIVVGGGEQLSLIQELAATRPWIKVTGPRFGPDKVELMLLADLFLMPGLVGLAVVDAGAASLPTVTTAFPYHSPEIAYVEHNVNGVIVSDWENAQSFANAVVDLLADPARLSEMRAAAERMAGELTIEAMADRFAEGVLKALDS